MNRYIKSKIAMLLIFSTVEISIRFLLKTLVAKSIDAVFLDFILIQRKFKTAVSP